MSSVNLIKRKTRILVDCKQLLDYITEKVSTVQALKKPSEDTASKQGQLPAVFRDEQYRADFAATLERVKALAIGLEQIVWALNSNKEHIKYVAKVFALPDLYNRDEKAGPSAVGQAAVSLLEQGATVPLKATIVSTIEQCEQVIAVCHALRTQLANSLTQVFMAHF